MHGVHTQRRAQDGAIVLKEIKKNAAGKVQEAVCNDEGKGFAASQEKTATALATLAPPALAVSTSHPPWKDA